MFKYNLLQLKHTLDFFVSFIILRTVCSSWKLYKLFWVDSSLWTRPSHTWSFPFWSASTHQLWPASSTLAAEVLHGALDVASMEFPGCCFQNQPPWFLWDELFGKCRWVQCLSCLHEVVKQQQQGTSSGSCLFSFVCPILIVSVSFPWV